MNYSKDFIHNTLYIEERNKRFYDYRLATLNRLSSHFEVIKNIADLKLSSCGVIEGSVLFQTVGELFESIQYEITRIPSSNEFDIENLESGTKYVQEIYSYTFNFLTDLVDPKTVSIYGNIDTVKSKLSKMFKEEFYTSNNNYIEIDLSIYSSLSNRANSYEDENYSFRIRFPKIGRLISNNKNYKFNDEGFLTYKNRLVRSIIDNGNVTKLFHLNGVISYDRRDDLVSPVKPVSEEDELWIIPRG
jgi:hypothetical protein